MYTVGLQLKSYYTVSTFAGLNCMPKTPMILGNIKSGKTEIRYQIIYIIIYTFKI